jgi:thiamine kinase-like enzyme
MSTSVDILRNIPANNFFPDPCDKNAPLTEIEVEEGCKTGSSSVVHFARIVRHDHSEHLRLAVKSPRLSGRDSLANLEGYLAQELIAERIQRRSAVFPQQYGLWARTTKGDVVRLEEDTWQSCQDQLELIIVLEAAIPEYATQLLEILSKLGLETIQDGRSFSLANQEVSPDVLEVYYQKIIELLITIHDRQSVAASDVSQYERALQNIILDPARFDGIRNTELGRQLPQSQLDDIRRKMMQLSQNLALKFAHRLTHVHGDAWASNFFVDVNQEEVYVIDPGGVGESDPALDLGFALMDLVMIDANNNARLGCGDLFSGEFIALADKMLAFYKEQAHDNEVEFILPLFVAFKLFVAATFDMLGKPTEQQALLDVIQGMLAKSLEEEEFTFSFTELSGYWKTGELIRKTNIQS